MLEATQSLVRGNETVVYSGTLFEKPEDVPPGVTVREVIVGGHGGTVTAPH